jgi:hypothetical protein
MSVLIVARHSLCNILGNILWQEDRFIKGAQQRLILTFCTYFGRIIYFLAIRIESAPLHIMAELIIGSCERLNARPCKLGSTAETGGEWGMHIVYI